MIGAGTVISPIIKIVTTVAILAAVYFFIVKPTLDTTEDISTGVSRDIARSQAEGQAQATAAELESARNSATSYGRSLLAGSQPWPEGADAVLDCVKKAENDIVALNKCEKLGQDISKALHDRNFAVSYADSLESQGSTAEAQQVRSCVEKAKFEARAMAACQRLADKLLFG